MTEPVDSGAPLVRPAAGLRLLGEYQGSGFTEPRFLVRRRDGQVIQLSRLLYAVVTAIAEGGAAGGWDAAQVAVRAGAKYGRELTADDIRILVNGKLTPLGVIVTSGTGQRPEGTSGVLPAPRVNPLPGLKIRGVRLRPRYRWRRWAPALGTAGVLAVTAVIALVLLGIGGQPEPGAVAAAGGVTGAVTQAAASRAQAAAWVAQQVSPDVTVSGDAAMCRLLRQDGFPAARLKPLAASAHGPLSSAVVVATADVRNQFGTSLAADYAPQVLASFGSGAARVEVRLVAPDGAAAFRAELAAGHAALVAAGRQLLGNKNIRSSPSARTALLAGQVDARLLALLSVLSAQMPVRLVAFSGAPGAGAGVPLRTAQISAASPAARSAVLALLDAQRSPFRPATATVTTSSGQPVVTLEYDAPAATDLSQP